MGVSRHDSYRLKCGHPDCDRWFPNTDDGRKELKKHQVSSQNPSHVGHGYEIVNPADD